MYCTQTSKPKDDGASVQQWEGCSARLDNPSDAGTFQAEVRTNDSQDMFSVMDLTSDTSSDGIPDTDFKADSLTGGSIELSQESKDYKCKVCGHGGSLRVCACCEIAFHSSCVGLPSLLDDYAMFVCSDCRSM